MSIPNNPFSSKNNSALNAELQKRLARSERAASVANPSPAPLGASPPKNGQLSTLQSLGNHPKNLKRGMSEKFKSSSSAPRKPVTSSELMSFYRLSIQEKPTQLLLDVKLPEHGATKFICNFFDLRGVDSPGENIAKVITRYPEKETVVLKALQKAYKQRLHDPKQKDLLFDELLYTLSYNTAPIIRLISKFFSNLEETCDEKRKASSNNNNAVTQVTSKFKKLLFGPSSSSMPDRPRFAERLFKLYTSKKKFIDLLVAIIGVDIEGGQPDTILRGENFLSTYLAHFALSLYLKRLLETIFNKLKPQKGVDWLDHPQKIIDCLFFLIQELKMVPELQQISVGVTAKVRKEVFSSLEKDKQDELIQNILKCLVFLRTICPFFAIHDNKTSKEFAKFLICLSSNKAYELKWTDNAEQNKKIQTANIAFKEAMPRLMKEMNDLITHLSESSLREGM